MPILRLLIQFLDEGQSGYSKCVSHLFQFNTHIRHNIEFLSINAARLVYYFYTNSDDVLKEMS